MAAILGILVAAPGCGTDSGDSPSDAGISATAGAASAAPSQADANGPLTIKVAGSCRGNGVMTLESSGFTPNQGYTTEVWYPDGRPYGYIVNGTADANGKTPNWKWNCNDTANGTPDPVGEYRLKMTDNATGRSAETTFKVER